MVESALRILAEFIGKIKVVNAEIQQLTCDFETLLDKLSLLLDARNELEGMPANAKTYQQVGNVFFQVDPEQLKKELDEDIKKLEGDMKKVFESITTLNHIKEPIQKRLDELTVRLQFLKAEK